MNSLVTWNRRGSMHLGGMTRYAQEIASRLPAPWNVAEVRSPPSWVATRPALTYLHEASAPCNIAPHDVLWSPFNFGPVRVDAPHVVTVHDVAPLTHPQFYKRRVRWAYQVLLPRLLARADRVITVSEPSRLALQDQFAIPAANIDVIESGVALPAVHGNPDAPDEPYVLHVGAHDPKKNQVRIQAAIPALREAGYRVMFVGLDRPGKGFSGTRIEATQAVSEERLAQLYAGAAATLLPSHVEGWGLPVVESLAMGAPVVATRSVPAAVANERHCSFVPVDFTPAELVAAVKDVAPLGAPDVRDVRRRYDWDLAAQAHGTVFTEAMES